MNVDVSFGINTLYPNGMILRGGSCDKFSY